MKEFCKNPSTQMIMIMGDNKETGCYAGGFIAEQSSTYQPDQSTVVSPGDNNGDSDDQSADNWSLSHSKLSGFLSNCRSSRDQQWLHSCHQTEVNHPVRNLHI